MRRAHKKPLGRDTAKKPVSRNSDPLGYKEPDDGYTVSPTEQPRPQKRSQLPGRNYEVTPGVLERIRELSKLNLSKRSIAAALGWSPTTLRRKMADHPAIEVAIEAGRAHGVEQVAQGLFQNAIDGSVPAQALYLKAADDWSNTQRIDVSGTVTHKHGWHIDVVRAGVNGAPSEMVETITIKPDSVSIANDGEAPDRADSSEDRADAAAQIAASRRARGRWR